MSSKGIFSLRNSSSRMTDEFGNGDRLISKSFGGGTSPLLATRGHLHRGYLLKRSNQPYQAYQEIPPADSNACASDANAAFDDLADTATIEIDPFDIPDLPRMPGMFSQSTDLRSSHMTLASPCGDSPTKMGNIVKTSPAESNFFLTPTSSIVTKTPIQQSIDALAAFFGLSFDPHSPAEQGGNENEKRLPSPSVQPLHIQNKCFTQTIRQPSRSAPIKVGSNPSNHFDKLGTFQTSSFHRRHSAPDDFIATEDEENPYSSHRNRSPPQDYFDAKGHLWRAKYCVLEDGILYFYRNTADGESTEAVNERREAREDTSGKQSAFSSKDLSKSPMPRHRHLGSSLSDDSSSNVWEKKVHLNCVGAVRSAEQEYGPNSFELIGIGNSEETSETLVLQARDSPDMKEWIFQFHRSLASFFRNIMGAYLDLDYFPSPTQTPMLLSSSPSEKQLHDLIRQHESPKLSKSLSHGHGRITVHRRRQDAPFSSSPPGSDGIDSPHRSAGYQQDNNPYPAAGFDWPGSSQQFQLTVKESSSPASPTERVLLPPMQIQPTLPPGSSGDKRQDPELAAPRSAYPETERPKPTSTTGKYVPPHLRKKISAAPAAKTKYIPPHMRKQQHNETEATKSRYVPPHLRNKGKSSVVQTEVFGQDSGEIDDAAAKFQLDDLIHDADDKLDVVKESNVPFKCGGCADPDVMEGSILDALFIPRKASRLGKVTTEAFGCYGGGKNGTFDDGESVLGWETGAVSECGIRDSNEDAYLIANDLLEAFKTLPQWPGNSNMSWSSEDSSHNLGLFALFDGHCGNQAARFAAEKLASFIYEQTTIPWPSPSLESNFNRKSPLDPSNVERVLREAIVKLDEEFCRVCHEEGRQWESGATALVALLVNEHLVIANLGDCRGILCRSVEDKQSYNDSDVWRRLDTVVDDSGRRSHDLEGSRYCFWKEVTDIHTPSARLERERIEKANGWVTTETEIPIGQLRRIDFQDGDVIGILKRCLNDHSCDPENQGKESRSVPQRILEISRVCGELAVSRALGDRDFKAAFNVASPGRGEDDWWDCPLFLPCPDAKPRKFRGDLVSNSPSFQNIRVGESGVVDEFLLFGCDGLWDVLDIDDAVRVTRDLLYRKKWTAKKAAARLAELAIHLGSSDNVTVIVVRLFSKGRSSKKTPDAAST